MSFLQQNKHNCATMTVVKMISHGNSEEGRFLKRGILQGLNTGNSEKRIFPDDVVLFFKVFTIHKVNKL